VVISFYGYYADAIDYKRCFFLFLTSKTVNTRYFNIITFFLLFPCEIIVAHFQILRNVFIY